MTADPVQVEQDGDVRWLRLNRPDKLNALDVATHDALRRELDALADDEQTRIVVLAGNGRAFSAGADLAARAGASHPVGWTGGRHASGRWQRLLDQLERIPQVTVAQLHSHCIGGAALLAVACDLRVGADDLQVRIPELAIGIPLTWGGIPRLVREVGLPLARDMVMTGRTLNAKDALAAGFIQRLATRDALDEATAGLIAEVRAMPPGPLAMTRAAFGAMTRDRVDAFAWADADLLRWAGTEPESREAAAAYAQRRRK